MSTPENFPDEPPGTAPDILDVVDVVDRAQRELAQGDNLAARDLLFDALRHNPASQPILELLAYSQLLLGERAAAGAAWFLTDKADSDPTAAAAFEALEKRYPAPISLARALPINAPSTSYPRRAQQRLDRLTDLIEQSGQEWWPPRDMVYFDEEGVDADDFVDDGWPTEYAPRSSGQRVVAATIVIALALASASIVLAMLLS